MISGFGLKKVAFIAAPEELNHWMLSRLIKRARGLDRDSFYFIDRDDPDLNLHIKNHGIKALVPLGEGSLRRLVGESNMIRWRGRVVKHQMGIFMVPTFAPSKLLPKRKEPGENDIMRKPQRFHGCFMRDVLKALDVAENGFERHPVDYLCDPTPEEFARWADQFESVLSADLLRVYLSTDIETPYKQKNDDESEQATDEQADSNIIRISYAYKPYTGVSVAYEGGYLPTIMRLNASKGIKVVWNGVSFDCPLLAQHGAPMAGTIYEGMDAQKMYESDLPKGLEWTSADCTDVLPWKHLNMSSPALYSCIDADVALRNMMELEKALKARGQWQAFLHHSVELMPILVRAGAKGNKVDVDAQNALREEIAVARAALDAEAQTLVPRELKPRKLYKTFPEGLPVGLGAHAGVSTDSPQEPLVADFRPSPTSKPLDVRDGWDIFWESEQAKFCTHCGEPASNKTAHFAGTAGPLNAKGKPTKLKNPCKVAGGQIELKDAFIPRFYQVCDFNSNSTQQLQAYIRWAGHPMGKNKEDKTKDAADAKHLEMLIGRYGKRHPIYALVLEVHKLSKVKGTYLPEPDANGYIHTEYNNSTSTWRLGSRKVANGTQMQNWGHKDTNPWALRARQTITASPGCKLIQIDSSSVEAVMQGWYMGDVNYIEIASQGVHAWLACKQLGWDFNPETVAKVKADHGTLYDQMKVTNHSTNFGADSYMLWKSFPKLFPSQADATRIQDILFALIPKLKGYQHSVRARAQKEGFLETPWHIRHAFYDVFTTDETGTVKKGKDYNRVVAFKPQSSNGCFQRDNIRLVDKTPYGQYLPAIANVHDSMGLDCPVNELDGAREMLGKVFTRPIDEMGGLRIGAEISIGDNWGAYDKARNPGGLQSVQRIKVFDPGTLVRAA